MGLLPFGEGKTIGNSSNQELEAVWTKTRRC